MLWTATILLVCAFALWRGGSSERLVALMSLVAWLATVVLGEDQNWFAPQFGVLAIDIAFLVCLTTLALRTGLNWLLFASGFQLLAVGIHVAMVVDDAVRARTYQYALIIWGYLVLTSLAVGAWSHARERRSERRR